GLAQLRAPPTGYRSRRRQPQGNAASTAAREAPVGDDRLLRGRRDPLSCTDGPCGAAQRERVLHAALGRLPLPARGRGAHRALPAAALRTPDLGRDLLGMEVEPLPVLLEGSRLQGRALREV